MTQEGSGTGVLSNGKRTSGVRKTWLTLLITFFLGFPTAGLLFFWNYTHATISRVGEEFAREALAEMQGEGGFDYLYRRATVELKDKIEIEPFEAWVENSSGAEWSFKRETSYVEERHGRSWQVAEFKVSANTGPLAEHPYLMSVSRLTVQGETELDGDLHLEQGSWRIDRFEPAEISQ